MIEIRFHGRGGQGAVIGGKILATALFSEGQFVQAFPTFGVERRGAPLMAFVRADDRRIDLRSQIYEPDHLVILDPTLLANPATFEGFKGEGWVLVNTAEPLEKLERIERFAPYRLAAVDAGAIAVRHRLGSATSPIVNTAILGAFCRVTGLCSIDAVLAAIAKGVPIKPEQNAAAAREAYENVQFRTTAPAKEDDDDA